MESDPMDQLFAHISTRGGPSPEWEDRWRHKAVDPVAWAWASSTDPHAMYHVLYYCGLLPEDVKVDLTNHRQHPTNRIERGIRIQGGPAAGMAFTWTDGDSTTDATRFQAAGLLRTLTPRAPTMGDLRRAITIWKTTGQAPAPSTGQRG